jgi:hypothetical protein
MLGLKPQLLELLLVTLFSLFPCFCWTDLPCSSLSTASGSALTLATAGIMQTFTITARTSQGLFGASDILAEASPFAFSAHIGSRSQHSIVIQRSGLNHPHHYLFSGSIQAFVGGTESLSLKLVTCKLPLNQPSEVPHGILKLQLELYLSN